VDVSLDDFRRHFELLSDETLLATNREELVEGARACYDEELARRGLNAPAAEEEPVEGVVEDADGGSRMALIATFSVAEEASLARGLLQIAGIPATLDNEYSPLGGFQLHLTVPSEYEQQALEVLESEIPEEELAAQAEAAGGFEEEEEEAEELEGEEEADHSATNEHE
jgi:hypothetical protein